MSKQLIIDNLRNYEGYSQAEANRLVDCFVDVLRNALRDGKNVELEGIGLLRVVTRKRRAESNLPNLGPTVVPYHKKTVKLSKGKDISYKEPKS